MKQIWVPADSLASLLLLRKELELTPEPYRCYDDMELVISFDEYIDFINEYLATINFLATETSVLRVWARDRKQYETALCGAFYRDVAVAIMKEIWYAQQAQKPATHIVHAIEDATDKFNLEYPVAMYQALKSLMSGARRLLLTYMANNDYSIDVTNLENNYGEMADYATYLYAQSLNSGPLYGAVLTKWTLVRSE